MYYGQYMSQFTARALVSKTQSRVSDQVLLGVNDAQVSDQFHCVCTHIVFKLGSLFACMCEVDSVKGAMRR